MHVACLFLHSRLSLLHRPCIDLALPVYHTCITLASHGMCNPLCGCSPAGLLAGSSPTDYIYQCFEATGDTPCSPYSDCKVNSYICCRASQSNSATQPVKPAAPPMRLSMQQCWPAAVVNPQTAGHTGNPIFYNANMFDKDLSLFHCFFALAPLTTLFLRKCLLCYDSKESKAHVRRILPPHDLS